MTIYSKSFPLDIASRIWDIFILEGESFLFRVALGILKLFQTTLESGTFDTCMKLLTHLPEVIGEEELFACIEKIDLKPDEFSRILEKEKYKMEKKCDNI